MTESKSEGNAALSGRLAQPFQVLPMAAVQDLIQPHFERRQHYLQLAREHGSPLYLLDREKLWSKAERFKAAFEKQIGSAGFYYAVKSNSHPEVAKILLEAGFGLDVSSGQELEAALSLGAEDLIFSGPGKTGAELQLAVAHAHKVVVLLDSFGELQRLAKIAAQQRQKIRCGVRLSVNPQGLWRKFGIPLEALADFWCAAGSCVFIQLMGLQFHASWNLSPLPQIDMLERLGAMLATLPEACLSSIEFIDIGGGYWPGEGEWVHPAAAPAGPTVETGAHVSTPAALHLYQPAAGIESFAAELGTAIRRNLVSVAPCRICLEPGRWLSHAAMHLLMSVVDKKAVDLVITDAGTNSIGWERFESDYFPVLNLSQPSSKENACHILGSLCTPHDVWGYWYFGEAIEPGDLLLIPNQGAYTYSLRQSFIKPLPAVVDC